MLHAIWPADVTLWKYLRLPWMPGLYLLLLCPYYGISTLMWFLLLVLITWDCDYQLINYIVLHRVTIFLVVGVAWCVSGFLGYASCVNELARLRATSTAPAPQATASER